ncbi:Ccc1-like protein [Parasponia andersonii]|uniref:Vacuolar iron transporter n=1 Tax=Parasponia andersonii TaxID=3476 RepID=A0A2P5CSZ0_PARAD|nr:Ccc1-like protein [Parasponia andersonii]
MAPPRTINQTGGEHKSPEKITASPTTSSTKEVVERAQWLRAAILGANDGLLSTTSLMLGVGAAKDDRRSMALSGLAGALAGACSMAVGEFVSVSTQREIEEKLIILQKEPKFQEYPRSSNPGSSPVMRVIAEDQAAVDYGSPIVSPNPHKAAAASALAFLSGSVVPLVSAVLVSNNAVRIAVIVVVATVALAVFGGLGAWLGGSPPKASVVRVVVGGWFAMAVTYGMLKPFDRENNGKD